MTTIETLINRIARDLIDSSNVRWSRPELLDYINDAISATVLRRPDLSRTTTSVATSSNEVTLPSDAYQLLSVNHVGNASVQFVDMNKLDQLYPTWRTMTGAPSNWTKHDLDERVFYLFPAPSAEVNVQLVYSKAISVSDETDTFPLLDIYIGVVTDFVKYRAYSKDSQNPSEANQAQMHLQAFAVALGDKATADSAKSAMFKQSEVAR